MITRRRFLVEVAVGVGVTALGSRAWGSMPPPPPALDEILGESPAITALRDSMRRLLGSLGTERRPPPVVIVGETGSGKGLVASVLHRAGPRAAGPFVPVRVPAIPDFLLESELFGFAPRPCPEATRGRPGLIQVAHHGVLLLEYMSFTPERVRLNVLQTIERGAVRRMDATRDEPADIWLITSEDGPDVCRPPGAIVLTIPPLRERGDDVLLLADHFLHRYSRDYQIPEKTLSRSARAALRSHCWPGNVRELACVMEQAMLLAGERIEPIDLGLPTV